MLKRERKEEGYMCFIIHQNEDSTFFLTRKKLHAYTSIPIPSITESFQNNSVLISHAFPHLSLSSHHHIISPMDYYTGLLTWSPRLVFSPPQVFPTSPSSLNPSLNRNLIVSPILLKLLGGSQMPIGLKPNSAS
jgi:hypothetical protein